ncbi:hypothetical protein CS369_22260, partial [Candidatus Symbiopectobacterium sp. 'North America']|nr:hypothetical protein [Candidatus Symbiopectobacterium sp. 'North America']
IDQIAQVGLSSLQVIYYYAKLFSTAIGNNRKRPNVCISFLKLEFIIWSLVYLAYPSNYASTFTIKAKY